MKLKIVQLCCAAALISAITNAAPARAAVGKIIHDAEYYFVEHQYGERWAEEDAEIDARLAQIREANGGKRPNIINILIDDVAFGEIGIPELGYVRGYSTPNIDAFADEGLSFMRMYTEPSCTPTRVAMMTGRHPVRTGLGEVKVALVGEGLGADEVTIAELLSQAGYNTAHVGKWHLGDIEEAFPHNQGFDYAAFPVHQQVQLSLMTRDAHDSNILVSFDETTQSNAFELDKRFKPFGLVAGLEARKGGLAREVDLEPGEKWTQAKYVEMNERYQRQALEQLNDLAAKDEPFFLQYWPLYPINFVRSDLEQARTANGGLWVERMHLLDAWIGDVLAEIQRLGIADNTIIAIMGDNGTMMQYLGKTGYSQGVYRGGKGMHLEGGVRVNAFLRWPAAIKAGTMAGDIIHVTDLYTTFARIARATEYIPRDRIVDGLDQTALLLKGENHGRRDYVYIYENEVLRSIVKQEFKWHLPAPGVAGAFSAVYNLYQDPREENVEPGMALWSSASFQDMLKRHKNAIKRNPHAEAGRDRPYGGIENLRPESELTVETFMSWQPE